MAVWLRVVLAIVLVLALIAVFVITYLINKKTKAPEGCPKTEIGCAGCMLNCGRREEAPSIATITKNIVSSNYKEEKNEEESEKKDDFSGKDEK